MGMNTVWSFGDAVDIVGQYPQPYVSGYLDYGGSAYGNETYDPLVNHFFPDNGWDSETCPSWHHGGYNKEKRSIN
jgi:hypothetical protein